MQQTLVEGLVTVCQAAQEFGVPHMTMLRWILRHPEIERSRVGTSLVVKLSDIKQGYRPYQKRRG